MVMIESVWGSVIFNVHDRVSVYGGSVIFNGHDRVSVYGGQ